MPPSSDSDALSVVMASGGESVGSRLGVATSRSNGGGVVSMAVGSSESIVTDVAVSGSSASDICLDLEASDSGSDVGETASGGLPRPGQVLEVVSRGRISGGFPRCATGRPTSSSTSSLSGAFGWPALALFTLQGLLGDDIKASMLACSMQISSHFSGVGSAAVAALLLHAGLWTLGLPSSSWNFSESCEKSHMPKGFVEIV